MTKIAIVNKQAGTAMGCTDNELREAFGVLATHIHLVTGDQLAEQLEEAAQGNGVDTLIIAGGDGSVNLAASVALEHDLHLAVVPLGTMNLFARAMDMPLDMHEAIAALKTGVAAKVDIGRVNGELFLNHVSVGLHPRVILLRDHLPRGGRLGKIWNGMKSYWRLLSKHGRRRLRISGDFDPMSIKAGLAVVSVNPLPEAAGHLPYREGQSQGTLAFYASTHRNAWQLNVLFARMAAGSWQGSSHVEYREASHVTIEAEGALHVSRDGEVSLETEPLRCSIEPGALKVIRPAASPATDVS